MFRSLGLLALSQIALIVVPSTLYHVYFNDLSWGTVVGVFGGAPYFCATFLLVSTGRRKIKLELLEIRSWLRRFSFLQLLLTILFVCTVVLHPEILSSKSTITAAALIGAILNYFLIGETLLLVTVEKEYELIFIAFIGLLVQFLAISHLTLETLKLLMNYI